MDNKLKVKRKNNFTFAIICNLKSVDSDGLITYTPFNLLNYTVTFGLKERKDSKTYIIYKEGTNDSDPATGLVTFDLLPDDTDIQPRTYVYGILLENSDTEDRRELEIENPYFEIEPSIVYEPDPSI